jgi:hypothetical protein
MVNVWIILNFINQETKAEDGITDLDFKADQQSGKVFFAQAGFKLQRVCFRKYRRAENSWASTQENKAKPIPAFIPAQVFSFIPTSAFPGLQGHIKKILKLFEIACRLCHLVLTFHLLS